MLDHIELCLNHFWPVFPFGFLVFSGVQNGNIGQKLVNCHNIQLSNAIRTYFKNPVLMHVRPIKVKSKSFLYAEYSREILLCAFISCTILHQFSLKVC